MGQRAVEFYRDRPQAPSSSDIRRICPKTGAVIEIIKIEDAPVPKRRTVYGRPYKY